MREHRQTSDVPFLSHNLNLDAFNLSNDRSGHSIATKDNVASLQRYIVLSIDREDYLTSRAPYLGASKCLHWGCAYLSCLTQGCSFGRRMRQALRDSEPLNLERPFLLSEPILLSITRWKLELNEPPVKVPSCRASP